MTTRDLEQVYAQADAEGLEEGSPPYQRRVLQLRIEACREKQTVSECAECQAFDWCEYAKEYLRLRAGIR